MKRLLVILLSIVILAGSAAAITPVGQDQLPVTAVSAIAVEKSTGQIIYAKNEHERLSPASVTKVMTLLLVMEELEAGRLKLTDMVVGSAHAASMGGSQIWLEEGEQLSVNDMLKAVAVVSANDCAVALAEHICGSEETFVSRMNERAQELGMKDTLFKDCSGLTEDPEHLTSAYDVAIMSRELILHEDIKQYTTIWMDSLRNGESGLTNTNKLVRFYPGATGLKTGHTSYAGHCISATAERDGTEYIAVIMKDETSAARFESAKALLNYAFANYVLCPLKSPEALPPIPVSLGASDSVQPIYSGDVTILAKKSDIKELKYVVELPESIEAPVEEGQSLGQVIVMNGETELGRAELITDKAVPKLTFFRIYARLLGNIFSNL